MKPGMSAKIVRTRAEQARTGPIRPRKPAKPRAKPVLAVVSRIGYC